MAVKPTVDPKWSSANNQADNIEPTLLLKNGGVPAGGVWGREFLNWQFYAISQWIDWVRSSALDKDNNLSDLTNAATARTNLGLNNAAVTLGANAATATKLATARKINGTPFNGSADITTDLWGEAISITLGNTAKTVNGSADTTWTLAEMGAIPSSEKAVAGGVATLNASTKVPLEQLSTATTTSVGVLELATNAETQTGTDSQRAVTPAALSSRTATETRTGLVEKATNQEALDGAADKFPDAAGVHAAFKQFGLGESAVPTLPLTTNNVRFFRIAPDDPDNPFSSPTSGNACLNIYIGGTFGCQIAVSANAADLDKIFFRNRLGSTYYPWRKLQHSGNGATNAETQAGTITGKWISPASLSSRAATETRTGLVELATSAEVQAGTDTSRAVTPAGLKSTLDKGATKLATAHKIGGVEFNGTTDIDLPGVNTTGNQNTSGNAGSVTNGVYTVGDQTIAGVKTFTSFPVTPSAAPTANYQAANKKYVDDSAIGVGQTWQNVTSSRTHSTTYTNSTGRPIFVSITAIASGTSRNILVNGVIVAVIGYSIENIGRPVSFIVPAGASYIVNGSVSSLEWAELR